MFWCNKPTSDHSANGRSFTRSQEMKKYYNIPRPLISQSFSINDFVIIQRFDTSSFDTAFVTLRLAAEISSIFYSCNFFVLFNIVDFLIFFNFITLKFYLFSCLSFIPCFIETFSLSLVSIAIIVELVNYINFWCCVK